MMQIPKTMRAVQGKDYGDIDLMLSVAEHVAVPSLEDLPPKQRKNYLIIKTHAVALAPGDCRVLSGKTRPIQGPPSFPYIPGGDVCGVVVEAPEGSTFAKGDRVAARFIGDGPIGALGDYAMISCEVCDKVPQNVSSLDAAVLASATPAICLADRIQEGERVLILGAGGGVGSHLVQFIKGKAAFIAGVSRNPQRLLEEPMLYDEAVDYNQEDPFSKQSWKDSPFDVVVDLAGGGWPRLIQDRKQRVPSIVKPASQGGRYLTTTPDEAIFEIHSMLAANSIFMLPWLRRAISTRTLARRRLPKYTFAMILPKERQVITRTLEAAAKGTIQAVYEGPFDFTTEEVRSAFRLQETRHVKGKVVIGVSDE